ncbi:MAG: hypothetical protein ACI855_004913 [Myxococcota bacterium]
MRGLLLGWALVASPAFAHGGPEVYHVLPESSEPRAVSTEGLFTQTEEAWDWVCDAAYGGGVVLAAEMSGDRLVFGTDRGLFWSDDGCTFAQASGPDDLYVSGVAIRGVDHWATTSEVLWYSTDADEWSATEGPWAGGLRGVAASEDGGTIWVFAFVEGGAEVYTGHPATGWTTTVVDTPSSFMLVHAVDASDRAYMSVPYAGTDQLIRIDAAGNASVLLEVETAINGVAIAQGIQASLFAMGVVTSVDDGQTWSEPTAPVLTSLEMYDGSQYVGTEFSQGLPPAMLDTGDGLTAWLEFTDVVGPRDCPSDTIAATECVDRWEGTQAILLGLESPGRPRADDDESETKSCSTVPMPVGLLGLLGLVVIGTQRRRRVIQGHS